MKRVKIKQVLLLAGGVLITALLFVFGETVAPKKNVSGMPPMMGGQSSAAESVDFASILEKAKGTLKSSQVDSISSLELQMKKVRGDKEKATMLLSLAKSWEKTGNVLVAGKYYSDAALISSDKATLEKAANLFYTGFPTTTDSMARIFGAQQGIE
ncbi:MAG: hypothetical protein ACHQD9_02125, partial [Chitinophagales bacterium]